MTTRHRPATIYITPTTLALPQFPSICIPQAQILPSNGNLSGVLHHTSSEFTMLMVKELLQKQVASSVRWEQSIRNMIENGVDTFVEIGPGKTLAGFMKKISRDVKMYNIETLEDVDKVVSAIKVS